MKIEKLSQWKMLVSVSKAGAQILQGASLFGTAEQKLDEGISNNIEKCLRYTAEKKPVHLYKPTEYSFKDPKEHSLRISIK